VGSNLGDRHRNIADALSALEATTIDDDDDGTDVRALRVVRTSYLRMTAPMYVTDQPAFLNGAVEIVTTLTPEELLRAIKRVERDLGRDVDPDGATAVRYGPRPVDLDILLFDDVVGHLVVSSSDDDGGGGGTGPEMPLEIPHPRIAEREFVLSPMRDLEGGKEDGRIAHPVSNATMSELLASLLRRGGNDRTEEERAVRVLPLPRGRMLRFNRTLIMGILNVTPDSFSDGGKHSSSAELAAERALRLQMEGADVIDIGGESTRPGAEAVPVDEELRRVIPVIERIRQERRREDEGGDGCGCGSDVPISIDTRSAVVARAAVAAGADIVNDVSGGTHDPDMLSCVAELGVPMIIMHMRGDPKTMQSLTDYDDEGEGGGGGGVVSVVARELMDRSAAAEAAGIPRWLQVVDPGIGFAKDVEGSLSLLNGMGALRRRCGDLPFLIGPSRKGFIGKVAGEADPEERDYGTVAACLAAIENDCGNVNGEACSMLRVHNVKAVKQAVMVYEAIRNAKR